MNVRKSPTPKQQLTLLKKELPLEELLSVYPEEVMDKLIANKEKLAQVAEAFKNTLSTVTQAAMVMKCDPKKCPFKRSCVLIKYDLTPDGCSCPVELKLCMELESAIMQELEIDSQSTIEMELLYDFIDAKLLDMRTSGLIGDSSVVQWITIDNGKAINRYKDVAPEFKVKMDLKKLKANILEEFMATRKAKKRYGLQSNDNTFEKIVKHAMNEVKSGEGNRETNSDSESTG